MISRSFFVLVPLSRPFFWRLLQTPGSVLNSMCPEGGLWSERCQKWMFYTVHNRVGIYSRIQPSARHLAGKPNSVANTRMTIAEGVVSSRIFFLFFLHRGVQFEWKRCPTAATSACTTGSPWLGHWKDYSFLQGRGIELLILRVIS